MLVLRKFKGFVRNILFLDQHDGSTNRDSRRRKEAKTHHWRHYLAHTKPANWRAAHRKARKVAANSRRRNRGK